MPGTLSRREFLGTATASVATVGVAVALPPLPAVRAQTPVKIGYIRNLPAGPMFLAHERGYFREAGIDTEMVLFNTGAEQVAGLSTGQLGLGFAALVAMMNAWARGVGVTAVADAHKIRPGNSPIQFVVRSDLADAIQTGADLRGRRVSPAGPGSPLNYMTRALLEQGGLTLDDIDVANLAPPDAIEAMANGAIEVAATDEPFATRAEMEGFGRRWIRFEDVLPPTQVSGLLVSEDLLRDRQRVTAITIAWLRGVREFLAGQSSDPSVIDVLARWSGYDRELIPRCVPSYMDPNGGIDVEDLKRQQAYWMQAGVVTAPAPLEQRVDLSFRNAALQELGPA
jgi:NitT/TauT family transport system substrate-binding protein